MYTYTFSLSIYSAISILQSLISLSSLSIYFAYQIFKQLSASLLFPIYSFFFISATIYLISLPPSFTGPLSLLQTPLNLSTGPSLSICPSFVLVRFSYLSTYPFINLSLTMHFTVDFYPRFFLSLSLSSTYQSLTIIYLSLHHLPINH